MTIEKFINEYVLLSKTEIERIKLLAYYQKSNSNLDEFNLNDIENWFVNDLHHSKPNMSRIKTGLVHSNEFVKGSKQGYFKINYKVFLAIEKKVKETNSSEEIITENTILPESLYKDTRGYVEKLSKQINASFENNISDGCAVLMRRLLEICLILSYEKLAIESEIQNADTSFKGLESIINNAKFNNKIALTKDSKDVLEDFRQLGNFSAHKIFYNCTIPEIKKIMRKYRMTIEELFYKAGLKK
jgi:hypothetical protein